MITNLQLYNIVSAIEIIKPQILDEAYKTAQTSDQSLYELIIKRDLLSDENIGQLIADFYHVPYVALAQKNLNQALITTIPIAFANQYHCLLINDQPLTIATTDPINSNLTSLLTTRFGQTPSFVFVTPRDFQKALQLYLDDPETTFSKLLQSNVDHAQNSPQQEPPIIEIVDTLLRYGYHRGASDIHIEPSELGSAIRFRIDGILYDIICLPPELQDRLTTRIKVMASLRTDDSLSPQDGKLHLTIDNDPLDIRVSIIPIIGGENIVLRLLSSANQQFSLSDLGLSATDAQKLSEAKDKPHGMILSTGPTGSGKTTTLYAILKLLNNRHVSIMTIEDPVEYEIDGISQIQVNQATNLTFADGLKSIVRQDPNVILVGEIRDHETADIAVNAAMTGHLLLSTLHANDAATAIPRFHELNIEPFLVSSTINLIIAQRLVRKICSQCRRSVETKPEELTQYISNDLIKEYFPETLRLYKGEGCSVCQNSGYSGRIGIFEIMPITESLREAINTHVDSDKITQIAIKEGMTTMLSDGIAKVKAGITTLEEVIRVTKEVA